jgi:hypothetical protein
MRLEIRRYNIDPTDERDIIFNESGDLGAYHKKHAWDELPTHIFQPSRKIGGGGESRVRLKFKTREAAAQGLAKLKELKASV